MALTISLARGAGTTTPATARRSSAPSAFRSRFGPFLDLATAFGANSVLLTWPRFLSLSCGWVQGLAGVVEEDLLEHLNVNHDPRYAAKQSKHRRARGRGVHSWKPPAPDGRHQPAAAVVGAAVLGSASAASPSPLTIRLPQAAMLINSVGTTAHHHDPSAMAASGSVANAFAAQPLSALLASTPTVRPPPISCLAPSSPLSPHRKPQPLLTLQITPKSKRAPSSQPRGSSRPSCPRTNRNAPFALKT
jgi:hypothetical protein